jgi:hypothetical protein
MYHGRCKTAYCQCVRRRKARGGQPGGAICPRRVRLHGHRDDFGRHAGHYLYEQHLSSGYAPIFKAAMAATYDERTLYIHEAREFVRTDKDQETEAEMEQMQGDADGSFATVACRDWKSAADIWEHNRQASEYNVALSESTDDLEKRIAVLEGKPYRARGDTAAALKTSASQSAQAAKVNEQYRTCLSTKETVAQKEAEGLYHGLRATAGLPAN